MYTPQDKAMYNNEPDNTGEEENSTFKQSYILYITGAQSATPKSSYVKPEYYKKFMYLEPIHSAPLQYKYF